MEEKKSLFFLSNSKISYHYWLFALSFSRNCGFYIKSKTFAISLDSRYYEIPTSVVLYLKQKYWVILKKVSFGIFRTILVSKEEKNFTIKSKDKKLSLGKFAWYLVIVKIIKIRHLKGCIRQKNHDSKIILIQK